MEFGSEKCAMLIMKCRKKETTERIERLNPERIKSLGETENYKSPGIVEAATIKQRRKKK